MPRLSNLIAVAFVLFAIYAAGHQYETACYFDHLKTGFWSYIHAG